MDAVRVETESPDSVVLPATVRLLPIVTLPLASLTTLFTEPEGWMTLIVFNVDMATFLYW